MSLAIPVEMPGTPHLVSTSLVAEPRSCSRQRTTLEALKKSLASEIVA